MKTLLGALAMLLLGSCAQRESVAASQDVPPLPPRLIDARTGVWFPPGKSLAAYEQMKSPAYHYTSDLTQLYHREPKFVESVCTEVVEWHGPYAALSSKEQNYRSLIRGFCMDLGIDPYSRRQREERYPADRAKFFKRLDAELAKADAMADEERDGEYDVLSREFYTGYDDELPAPRAVRLFALRPDAADSVEHLMKHVSELQIFINTFDARTAIGEYLQSKPDRISFRSGHRFFLLLSGKYADAKKATDALANVEGRKTYETVVSAMLDALQGNREPLRAAVKKCPPPAEEAVAKFYGIDDGETHCQAWVYSIVKSAVPYVSDNGLDPAPWRELLLEYSRSETPIVALNAARRLMLLDENAGIAALRGLLARDLPSGIRDSTYLSLLVVSSTRWRAEEAERWANCFMSSSDALGTFDADTWARLKAMPLEPLPGHPDAYDPVQTGRHYLDVVQASASAGDFARAERAAEAAAAFEVEKGKFADVVRQALLWLAWSEAKAGRTAEAARIVGYMTGQPLSGETKAAFTVAAQELKGPAPAPADTPWDAPHGGWKRMTLAQCR